MEGEDGEEWRKFLCKDRIAHKVASCFGFEGRGDVKSGCRALFHIVYGQTNPGYL